MPPPGSKPRSPRCSSARAGSAAGCTSCATCSRSCPRAARRWSPPRTARSSPNPTPNTSTSSSRTSPPCSARACPRSSRCSARRPRRPARPHRLPSCARDEDQVDQPLQRLNKESKRRTDVSVVFPNPAALLCLAGTVLIEAHDEWQVTAERRYLSERSMAMLTKRNPRRWPIPELRTA